MTGSNGEWDDASDWSKWTFSIANPMICKGEQTPLQFDDLMSLPKHDVTNKLVAKLEDAYVHSTKTIFMPRLLIALCRCHKWEILVISIQSLAESAVRVASPVALRSLIAALGIQY